MTKDDFNSWIRNSTTQEVLDQIRAARLVFLENLTDPSIVDSPSMEKQCARYIGNIEAFDYILNIKFEPTEEVEQEDDEQTDSSWT